MTWRTRAAAVLREPLTHFLLIGGLVYVALAGRAPDLGERRVRVNSAAVSQLVGRFVESFHRPPTQAEMDGLISDYVREQVYYREALRLGLDQNDEIVMRRMRNKMIAIATSDVEAKTPSDADLQALLDKAPGRYAKEPQFSFAQVYLGADSPAARAAAKAALARLNKGESAASFAKPAPLPSQFTQSPGSEIAAQFGDEFTKALAQLPRGQWAILTSGLGLHVVKLEAVTAIRPPKLEDVRQQVTNDWHNAAMRQAEEDAYRKILKNYDVVIEKPQ